MPSKKQALVKQVRGITLVAKSDSRHWITMDGPERFGGSSAGPNPHELLLMALGGCTAMDVIPILMKKQAAVEDVELHLTATVADEHPKVFTGIHIEYVVCGDGIISVDVERAIELSLTKYCPITAMLRPSVAITHSYRIEKPRTPLP